MRILHPGMKIEAGYEIRYTPEPSGYPEGVELIHEGGSVVLSCKTDWTLGVSKGSWPRLPDWCWPVTSWRYERMERVGNPGFDVIISCSEGFDEVGEPHSVQIEFDRVYMIVDSGKNLRWEFIEKGNHHGGHSHSWGL